MRKIVLTGLICFSLPGCAVFADEADDAYILGYAQALLEKHFELDSVKICVEGGDITVQAPGLDCSERQKMERLLSEIEGAGAVTVYVDGTPGPDAEEMVCERITRGNPVLFPRTKLFKPLTADPRWPHFFVSYRYYNDDDEFRSMTSVGMGETLNFFKDNAVFGGEWQLGIEAAVFGLFDMDSASLDLINTDYWTGLPVSYRLNRFSARMTLFHQSSHLGDEYLLRDNDVERINLSYEGLDLIISYDFCFWFRAYGGGGYLVRHEPDELEPASAQYGVQFESPATWAGGNIRPVGGINVKHREEADWDAEISLRAGLQLESLKSFSDGFNFVLEYFNGPSYNGQFYECSIEYFGFGVHYYF